MGLFCDNSWHKRSEQVSDFPDLIGVASTPTRRVIIAATELASHLTQLKREHPDFHQFLICHSHGGNVALFALSHLDASRTINGVVTLGTPFITCHRRALSETTRTLKWTTWLSVYLLWVLIYAFICIGIANTYRGLLGKMLWWSYTLLFLASTLLQIQYIDKCLNI